MEALTHWDKLDDINAKFLKLGYNAAFQFGNTQLELVEDFNKSDFEKEAHKIANEYVNVTCAKSLSQTRRDFIPEFKMQAVMRQLWMDCKIPEESRLEYLSSLMRVTATPDLNIIEQYEHITLRQKSEVRNFIKMKSKSLGFQVLRKGFEDMKPIFVKEITPNIRGSIWVDAGGWRSGGYISALKTSFIIQNALDTSKYTMFQMEELLPGLSIYDSAIPDLNFVNPDVEKCSNYAKLAACAKVDYFNLFLESL